MNASKQKGTAFETALVRWLESQGIPAKRIVLHGNQDQGDVDAGLVNFEAKNCNSISLSTWVKEAEVETAHAGKPVVVVAKRKGISDAGQSYVITTLAQFMELMYHE